MQRAELCEKLEQARSVGIDIWKMEIDEAAGLYPDEALVWFHKGEYAAETWDWATGITCLEKAHQKEPDNNLYKARLAHLLSEHGGDEAAHNRTLGLLTELIRAEPQNKAYHLQLANHHLLHWNNAKAIKYLSRVLELDSEHLEARKKRAEAYSSEGELEKAQADVEQLLQRFPENDSYWQLKGEVLIRLGFRVEEAVAALRKAVALNPENTTARANIANYYFNAQRYPEAIAAYTEHIQATGETPKLYRDRADCQLHLENYQAALADLDKAAELGEEAGNFHLSRGKAQFGLKNYEATVKELEVALEKNCWQEGTARLTLAKAYLELNRLEDAVVRLEAATDDFMCGNDAHYLLGNVRAEQGDMEKAIEHWKIAADDYHEEAQKKLKIYLQKAKPAAAAQDFAGATQKNTNSPFLKSLFTKLWVVDMEKTKSSSEQIEAMPTAMVDVFLQMFKGISIEFTPEVIKMNNVMGSDVEAAYRIEAEGEGFVELYGRPEGQDARNIRLDRKEGQLLFNMEANGQPMQLWLKEGDEGTPKETMNPEDMMEALMSGLGDALSNLSSDGAEPEGEESSSSLSDKIAGGLNTLLQQAMKEQGGEETANPELQMVHTGPLLETILFDTWFLDSDMTLAYGIPFKNFPSAIHDKLRKQFESAALTVTAERLEMKGGGQTTRGSWEAIEQSDYFLKAKGYKDGDGVPADFEFTLLPQHLRMKMQTANEQQPTVFFFTRY